jgi:hypothetical protein
MKHSLAFLLASILLAGCGGGGGSTGTTSSGTSSSGSSSGDTSSGGSTSSSSASSSSGGSGGSGGAGGDTSSSGPTSTSSGTTTVDPDAPLPGHATANLTFSDASGTNADTSEFNATMGDVVLQGEVLDVIVQSPTRLFELLLEWPGPAGPRDLDGFANAISYAQDGNQKSWLAKTAPFGTATVQHVIGSTFECGVQDAHLEPSGFVGADGTGTFTVSGSLVFTLP